MAPTDFPPRLRFTERARVLGLEAALLLLRNYLSTSLHVIGNENSFCSERQIDASFFLLATAASFVFYD